MSPGARVSIVALFALMLAVGAGNLLFTTSQVDQLRTQLQASCAFAADIGSVPLPDSPTPSKLGVSLVVDSRAQWRELRCPGPLPEPPGLAKWAAYYRLPGS